MALQAVDSPHSVGTTVDRAVAALGRRGITVFARIDHAAAARAVGLELADEEVLIFGDPRAGTSLMQSDPAVGYELPLRLLAWDAGGQTMIGYRPPTELVDAYEISGQSEILGRMESLLEQLVAESVAAA
jgi:uncharacterized protein (DUF302 family)